MRVGRGVRNGTAGLDGDGIPVARLVREPEVSSGGYSPRTNREDDASRTAIKVSHRVSPSLVQDRGIFGTRPLRSGSLPSTDDIDRY